MTLEAQRTADLGRDVLLRPGTTDRQVWSDTFTGRYHIPPPSMPHPRTVLDLGANIGLTAAHYNALWPEAMVVAVELDEACADLARQNAPQADVRCYAVSGLGGWGTYDPTGEAHGYAFTRRAGTINNGLAPNERHVSSYTLRQIINRCFVGGSVDFVKMDVEGEEWSIFEHASWAPLVRHLLVELHGDGGSASLLHEAVYRLTQIGFKACWHEAHPQAVYAYQA